MSYFGIFLVTKFDYTALDLFWFDCVAYWILIDSCHLQAGLKYTKTGTCTRQNSIKLYLSKKSQNRKQTWINPRFLCHGNRLLRNYPGVSLEMLKSSCSLSCIALRVIRR